MNMRHHIAGALLRSAVALGLALGAVGAGPAWAQCPAALPALGAAPAGPLPLFPADNWWNADVSAAPVDPGSAAFISFIGAQRTLHPDFGGEASPGSVEIYGFPWAVVGGTQPRLSVNFQYASESDGVDLATGKGVPFYPIPSQAISTPHWIEGGAPGTVDQRQASDRHLLVIDCTNRYLYELYNVWYDASKAVWNAGSGAFFDMTRNDRRPEGWTSADAAGLAIFPGLVRYDEVGDPAVASIQHALRVTVRATNGHVWPASHSAGSTSGALPLGARLRLKKSVNGSDPALRTSDAGMRKVFRAMQQYGLIVADNGSDLFVSGTFDTRWNNDVLNPAFALLQASDFEVVQLGWKPSSTPPPAAVTVSGLAVNPASVIGGRSSTGTVQLSAAAPSGGAQVTLSTASAALAVPATVTVAQGGTSATFTVNTGAVSVGVSATITAAYGASSASAILAVNPASSTTPVLSSLTLSPAKVRGGGTSTGTVVLSAAAPSAGATVALGTSNATLVKLPVTVTVPAGATSKAFAITVARTSYTRTPTVTATYAGVKRSATLTVTR